MENVYNLQQRTAFQIKTIHNHFVDSNAILDFMLLNQLTKILLPPIVTNSAQILIPIYKVICNELTTLEKG